MLSRQECVAITTAMEQADNVAHEVTVPLDEGPAPEAWAGLHQTPGSARPLDALHNMLHDASVLSSHLRVYQPAVRGEASAGTKFFDALHDFLASSGDPALYENRLTEDGITAAQAAAAAATAVQGGQLSPDEGAAAGVVAAQATDAPTTAPAGNSAFAAEAAEPGLPLMGAAGVSKSGLVLCPGVPNTAALGVKGGLTRVVPAELHLPKQHAALFSTEQQRALVHRGADSLAGALNSKLMLTLQLWLDTFEECKSMLPQVEHLRAAADKARGELDAAVAAVVQAEASHALTTPGALTQAGLAVPRVLVRGTDGTMLTQPQAEGGAGSNASAEQQAGGGASGSELVAVPAVKKREEMYKKEKAETDATLSFELAEKVLRDRLKWLVTAGAGFKALLTSALAHGLRAAADMGEVGHAAGGTTAGASRAPEEELLTPFPAHVLARLRGEHLPTLPDVVLSDQARLARWGQRYRAAMATEAAAAAAAAGAQMMAAAAAPVDAGSASSVGPASKEGALLRTDEGSQGGVAAGTAAVLSTGSSKACQAAAAAPAGPAESDSGEGGGGSSDESSRTAAGVGQSKSAGWGGVAGGMRAEVERAAAESGLPLDLLAAAVAADVREQEAVAVRATKGDLAWHLLHDASITVGKEQAVLLPEVRKAVGGVVPALLTDGHAAITDALSQLSRADPASSGFDLPVLEVVEVLEHHAKVLKTEVLPALSESDSRTALRSLARAYRRAAAAAPTRPHAWLLDTATGSDGGSVLGTPAAGRAARWVSAAVGAAGRAVKAPVRAGVALADAAADAAHFGPSHTPLKA